MRWKKIDGFPNYSVSDEGQVRNDIADRLLAQSFRGSYLKVSLYCNGVPNQVSVHRLVANAFIPNENCKKEVNHINGNKTDNRAKNLEWVTSSENYLHRCNVLMKRNGTIPVLCVETNTVYDSITEAANATGARISHLSEVLKGKLNKTAGFHWRYADGKI